MSRILLGNIVFYCLTAEDAEAINRRRTTGSSIADRIKEDKWPLGAQAHIGNEAAEGQVYPAMVVRDWDPNAPDPMVNLQVFLDGNDTYWATSRHESQNCETVPGKWCGIAL
jgi:hypothetical protein